MDIKNEILNNLNKLNYSDFDQNISGRGHYSNLSLLICNLLKVGFTTSEVESIVFNMPINLKDKSIVKRWNNFITKNPDKKSDITLLFFKKLLGIKIDKVEFKHEKEDLMKILKKKSLLREHKVYSKLFKNYLMQYKCKHINKSYKSYFNGIDDFFHKIFNDDLEVSGLVANFNESEKCYFNSAINHQSNKINEYTHWVLNRPYSKSKKNLEGICETDIFNARYFLIEVDEGLTLQEQIKLADMLIDFGIPVKMVTFSGSRSIHIICDLSIGIMNRLNQKGMLSSPKNVQTLRNHCNLTFKEYIPCFTKTELTKFFGYENVNDYYKAYIKMIYDVLYSLGINVDFSCKNLNRWTRIPGGIRKKDGKDICQRLLYFRESACSDDDVLEKFQSFVTNIKKQIFEDENRLFEL